MCRDIASNEVEVVVLNEPEVCKLDPDNYENDSRIRVISSEMEEIQVGVRVGLTK